MICGDSKTVIGEEFRGRIDRCALSRLAGCQFDVFQASSGKMLGFAWVVERGGSTSG